MLWNDCVRYGCISAGGGRRWRDAIQRLTVGSKVYAYAAGFGYVGYGEVTKRAVPIKDFTVGARKKPLLEVDLATSGLGRNKDNLELSEYVAGIKRLRTFEKEQARRISAHVCRGTVCELSQKTLKLLRKEFKA